MCLTVWKSKRYRIIQKNEMKDRIWNMLFCLLVSSVVLVGAHYARRILWFDQFVIPTHSMEPTLLAGDRIWVDKTLMGPRIYRCFDFEEGDPLVCTRLKGRREVRPNDVIVFNFPYGWKNREIAFRLNRLYAKRCIGCPGDSVGIRNGWFVNNHHPGVMGDAGCQAAFESMDDESIGERFLKPGWMHCADTTWTIRDFGPIYVPGAGDNLPLNAVSRALYSEIIAFETGTGPDSTMEWYTFRGNWYFACGDNVASSNDSRHWGFVPEDFIVGIAARISFSRDPDTGRRRPGRFLRPIY